MQAASILGFDFGLRRIGVAVGQRLTGTASAIAVIAAKNGIPDWQALDALINTWKPSILVVGLPLTLEGDKQFISIRADDFVAALEMRYSLPLHRQDERMSSKEAEADFTKARKAGHAKRKSIKKLDAIAAQIILERWLENHPQQS